MADKTPNVPAIAATFHNGAGVEVGTHEAPVILQLRFGDGMTIHVGESDFEKVRNACMWHGLKQKLVDAAAMSRNPETGRAATIADKRNAVEEVLERLQAGEWNKVREGGASGGLLYRALVRLYDGRKTADEIKAFLESKTDAEKAALRKNSKVAAIIEQIRAETVTDAGVDSNALLGELDA